jgi:hypothetical protein
MINGMAPRGPIPGETGHSRLDSRWMIVIAFLIAVSIRVAMILITRLGAEDAYITFRYASQLVNGNGFVHNTGEPIYGTTTPLFAILLAIWHRVSPEVLLGAWGVNVAAAAGGLILTWAALRRAGVSSLSILFVLGGLLATSKFWSLDITGMETPLVILLMAASLYLYVSGRPVLTGVIAGLLLWTRVDTVVWVLALVITASQQSWRDSARIGLAALLTYLPWLFFASAYFGSPVPHTIIAKLYAYPRFSFATLPQDLRTSLILLSPLSAPSGMDLPPLLFAVAVLLMAGWYVIRTRSLMLTRLLGSFAIMEAARLILSHSMIFTRYFAPLLWAVMILFGLGLAAFYARYVQRGRRRQVVFLGMLGVIVASVLTLGVCRIGELRRGQAIRNEGTLKQIGHWLNQNSPPGASVLLEPLGYIGYFADRRMLDVVGLITPQVVELKRAGNQDVYLYIPELHPDYLVAHCDEASGWLERSGREAFDFTASYSLAAEFNPLDFDPGEEPGEDFESALSRSACYQIWGRNSTSE